MSRRTDSGSTALKANQKPSLILEIPRWTRDRTMKFTLFFFVSDLLLVFGVDFQIQNVTSNGDAGITEENGELKRTLFIMQFQIFFESV